MTVLAVSAALLGFLSYGLRRTAQPDDVGRHRISNLLNIAALGLVAVYFFLRVSAA